MELHLVSKSVLLGGNVGSVTLQHTSRSALHSTRFFQLQQFPPAILAGVIASLACDALFHSPVRTRVVPGVRAAFAALVVLPSTGKPVPVQIFCVALVLWRVHRQSPVATLL